MRVADVYSFAERKFPGELAALRAQAVADAEERAKPSAWAAATTDGDRGFTFGF